VKPIFSFRTYIILGGPLVSSLSLYFILSSLLLFPSDIAVSLSAILFSLLFGLSSYLLLGRDEYRRRQNDHFNENNTDTDANGFRHNKEGRNKKNSASNLIFISIYIISLIIVATSKPLDNTEELFIAWNQLSTSPMQIMQLVGAFLLSFFFPGYALVYLLVKGNRLRSLPMVLLSFLFSMLIVGFSVYVVVIIIGTPTEYVNPIIIGVDISILILYIIYNKAKKTLFFNLNAIRSFSQLGPKFRKTVTTENIALFIIFASLFSLIIFYTCYLEKGVIVGDQWFHHGRALLINSGTFKEFAMSGEGKFNPPFFSALLAGFFSLSGVPSVNAYVSLNVLNMMAIFAFYYFFSRWVPSNQRKSVVLATTLFVLSSGFGWVLVVNSSLTNSYHSQESSLENLHLASIRSSDIRTPNTFINVGHPTFTSPLIIIGLPAGFVLLGLIHEHSTKQPKLRFICIITAITVLGILSHPEFYLFMIIGSILILSFRLSYGNLIYTSFLFALFFCILVDFLSPLNYYSAIKILNAPLLILCLVFVSTLWGLYVTRIFSKLYRLKAISHSFPFSKFANSTSKNAIRIIIISVLAYFYLFTFIVLEALSIYDIQIQVGTSTQRNIPWYLYPMKFGVVGLLGLAFIASYLFKRFEKEFFVFGIIAVVSLIAGPYYDEHRFSKYIMVGMVGFASLLVYKIILFLQRPNSDVHQQSRSTTYQLKPLVSSVLIGLVITSAGLSVFMLAGYKAVGYKNPSFQEDFFRINFPSQSEMNLLNFFHHDLPNLKTYFVAIQANESQTENLFSKILGFSAIPKSRILQNPQSLNASTLEGLYSTLYNDNIRYIILPKVDANSEEQIQKPLHFVLDNFPRVYQDDTSIALKVPDLSPPLSQRSVDTGLVYDKRNELPPLTTISPNTNSSNSNNNILQYNYKFFNNIENSSKFIEIEKKVNVSGNESKGDELETLTLHGDEKPRTLWSSSIKEPRNVNYVEGKFRLVVENRTRNDLGIMLEDKENKQQYYVSIDKDSLDLKQKSLLENMSNKERILSQNQQLPVEQRGLWHTLKILVLKDTINVYLDDVLKIKAPKLPFAENFNNISKIGITANKNIVQFNPLKIGYLSDSALESYQKNNMRETYYHHYYPLSALAISKLPFDTFIEGDFSVLSKRNVILPSDPRLELPANKTKVVEESGAQEKNLISEEKFNRYLDFVKSGGTLIVINQDNDNGNYSNSTNKSEQGAFSKLLSLRYGDKVNFNGIVSETEYNQVNKPPLHQNFINISGVATNIKFSNSSDLSVKSYYVGVDKDTKSNYKAVAPFAIEKKYGQGKLVLVNIAGYFDSLYKSNNQVFTTIYDIPNMIELKSDAYYVTPPKGSKIFANARILGDMKISNYTDMTIKSNSLLLDSITGGSPPYNLTINNISASPLMRIYSNNSNHNGSLQQQYINENSTEDLNNVFSNITIKDLKLYGPYEVIINSTNSLLHMSATSSYYDYIAAAIPKGFDMLLNLSQGGYAEFTLLSCKNNSYCRPQQMRISGGEVAFHNIEVDTPSISSIPVYVKSPEIIINNGTAEFKLDSNSNNPLQPSGNILANGNIVENIDRIETYNSFNKNGTKTDYVTYLKSLDIQGNYMTESKESDTLRLPGDISIRAKDKGIGVPWETMMVSFTSVIMMISVVVVVIAVKYYIWPKIKQNKKEYQK
jgi:hypothetical protein